MKSIYILIRREAQNKLDYDKEEVNQYYYSFENMEDLDDATFLNEQIRKIPETLTKSIYVYGWCLR